MIALLMILASGLVREVSAQEAPLWDRFETSVVNLRSYANPFTDVTLVATFLRPDKSRLPFWGFYDGDGHGDQTGNVWRLRFMPDQVGMWPYECSFSDGVSGKSGTFRCVADGAKPGPLRIDPANPHCWVFADGSHFFPRAYTAPELFVAGNQTHRAYWIDYFFGTKHNFNLCNANLLNFVGVGEELNWQGAPYEAPDPAQNGKYVTIAGNGLFPFLYSGTRPRLDGGSNVDWLRTGAWGSLMGGAFYLYAECFEPTLTWGDGNAFAFIEIMNDFLDRLAYWKLKPDHALVNSGSLCLADPGREYVVYRQSGGTITIDLPNAGSAFQAEWLDPRTGVKKAAAAVEGGAKRTFTCPETRDWVLHLSREDGSTR